MSASTPRRSSASLWRRTSSILHYGARRLHRFGGLYLASDDSYISLGYAERALKESGALFSYNRGEHSAGTTGLLYYALVVVSHVLRLRTHGHPELDGLESAPVRKLPEARRVVEDETIVSPPGSAREAERDAKRPGQPPVHVSTPLGLYRHK